MNRANAIPYFSLTLIALFALYMWNISDQPRMADGLLTGDEMTWTEKVMVFCVPASIVCNLVLAMRRAKQSGSLGWLLASLFIWPLSYVYTLFVNPGNGR